MTKLPGPAHGVRGPGGIDGVGRGRAGTSTKGADVALRSVEQLEQKHRGFLDTVKRGVVAALLGITLLGAVTPSHADTSMVQAPQTTSWFEAAPPTGPPEVRQLLGLDGGAAPRIATPQQQQVSAATQQAFDTFHARLSVILHHDAASLAAGRTPLQPGAPLSAQQQKDLESALRDLLEQLPLGAFAPAVQNTLRSALGLVGQNVDVSTMTLKQAVDLGKDGARDLARDLLRDLKEDHPGTFWGLASAAASAAIVVGYTQGTDALAKIGIKPEIQTHLFDDGKLQLGLRAGPRFSDPRATVGFRGTHTFDGGTVLQGGVKAELAGKSLDVLTVNGNVRTPGGFTADGEVRLDGSGKPFDARLSASQTFSHGLGGGGTGTLWGAGRWSDGSHGTVAGSEVSLGVTGTHGRWTSSLSATHRSADNTSSATLSMGRSFDVVQKNDLNLSIQGTVNGQGQRSVGVGVTFHF